ncbi:MAG: PIN domain-containing protein [Spirochaetia bacterium]|nr:PIN domain-containing protein [Spirochaetia bacterium]
MKLLTGKAFIDTNILLYTYSIDEPHKQEAANSILEKYSDNIIISSQVINELINILFKKFKLTTEDIENAILEIDSIAPIVGFDLTTQIKAIRLKDRYKLHYFDALIIATALENNCKILFSEDM